MALIYGSRADAIFSDTGWEHDELYKQLEDVEKKIRAWHGNDFKVIRVKSETHPEGLGDYIKEGKFYPFIQCPFLHTNI